MDLLLRRGIRNQLHFRLFVLVERAKVAIHLLFLHFRSLFVLELPLLDRRTKLLLTGLPRELV